MKEKSFKNYKLLNSLAHSIFTCNSRTRKKLVSNQTDTNIVFTDYNKLQVSAKVVLSDSGTIWKNRPFSFEQLT